MKSPNENNTDATETILREINEKHDKFVKKQNQKLEEAKRNANKEPFNIDELEQHYDFKNNSLNDEIILDKDTIRELEITYYLNHPELTTMKKLAEHLVKLDTYES